MVIKCKSLVNVLCVALIILYKLYSNQLAEYLNWYQLCLNDYETGYFNVIRLQGLPTHLSYCPCVCKIRCIVN